jgi:hypothetical protein
MRLKLFYLVTILLLINIGPSLAQFDFSLLKQNYSEKETLQADITFVEDPYRLFSVTDIYLYNKTGEIKIAPILTKISDKHYFLYFDLPNLEEGDYNLTIQISFLINSILKDITKAKTFNVLQKNESITIKPAMIKLDEQSLNPYFKIYLKSYYGDADLEFISPHQSITLSKYSINLPEQTEKYFYVYTNTKDLPELNNLNITLNGIDEYIIPIWIINRRIIQEENITEINETIIPKEEIITERTIEFLTELDILNKTIKKEQYLAGPLKFKNYMKNSLNDLTFTLTGNLDEIIKLNITHLDEITSEETKEQYIEINKEKDAASGLYYGELILNTKEGYSDTLSIYIYVEYEPVADRTREKLSEEPKEPVGEEEFGETYEFLNFSQPVSTVKEEEKKSSFITVFLILIIFIVIIYILFRKVTRKRKMSLEEYVSSLKKK